MTDAYIKSVERALTLHINYRGVSSGGKYLQLMDNLAWGYSGAPAEKVSKLLNEYFKAVGVKDLDEALERLRALNKVE